MQTVSTAWKDNQRRTMVGESFIEVSFDITDPAALADATATDNGSAYISDTSGVTSEVDKNTSSYVTLEQNMWLLDGSRESIPVAANHNEGYVGDTLSDKNGLFSDKVPTITVNFSRVHTNPIPAVTVKWGTAYNEYAEDFVVTAFNGNTVVVSQDVVGNKSVQSVVEMDIVNFDRITLTVLKWCLPNRRARVEELFIGMNKVYSKSDLLGYSHSQTADPLSTSLPKAEISFTVSNMDNAYNPYNVNGLSRYLMERQEIKTRYGYRLDGDKIEWIKGGTFYLSEWGSAQNGTRAEFTARDVLELMSAVYYEGQYSESGESLYDLALDVLNKANLPLNNDGSEKWYIDESLKDVYTVAPLPVDTLANCLQLIANAGQCAFYQDRNGTLHIEPLWIDVGDYDISLRNSYSKSDMKQSKPVKQVNVAVYQYFEDEKTSELYKGSIENSGTVETWVVYSNPAKNVSATVSGGSLISAAYYTNACKLIVSSEGNATVTVTGTVLKESKSDIVPSNSQSGEIVSIDNPLITSRERATLIADWIYSYLSNRTVLSSNWRADPRLDALDLVNNENDYGFNGVLMTMVGYEYNGAFRGKSEGRVILNG